MEPLGQINLILLLLLSLLTRLFDFLIYIFTVATKIKLLSNMINI